jgi:hypothetical protein
MTTRMRGTAAALGALLLLTVGVACGDDDDTRTTTEDTVTDPDQSASSPDDTADQDDFDEPDWDDYPSESARERAREVLGTPEDELDPDVRIARRGDEGFMLTEDYVLGRITVELDEEGGTFVVTQATVELPDGPEIFTRDG